MTPEGTAPFTALKMKCRRKREVNVSAGFSCSALEENKESRRGQAAMRFPRPQLVVFTASAREGDQSPVLG